MSRTEREEPLAGGWMSAGVVRVGETVRRPPTPASPFVQQLLQLLERREPGLTPRYLGRDREGRESLEYLPGWVPARLQRFTERQVMEAGRLLQRFHRACAGTQLAGGQETVCHGDAGPYNTVFRPDGLPYALIDLEMAGPGPALDDLAYSGWLWCLSSKPERGPLQAQAEQLRLFTQAYQAGQAQLAELPDAIARRQKENARWWEARLAGPPLPLISREQMRARVEWSRREREFTLRHRELLRRALQA